MPLYSYSYSPLWSKVLWEQIVYSTDRLPDGD